MVGHLVLVQAIGVRAPVPEPKLFIVLSDMLIKGIGFDYSGVVAGTSSTKFSTQVCQILNITNEKYKETYFKFNHLSNEEGLSWAETWKLIVKDLDKEDRYTELMEMIQNQDKHTPNKGVLSLLKKLHANGYKLGLLSNNTIGEANIMRQHKIDTYFDTFLISEEIDVSKPKNKAFEILFEKLGTKAEETIFIDDTENSLRTADDIGYQPLLFTDVERLIKDLEGLGIKI